MDVHPGEVENKLEASWQFTQPVLEPRQVVVGDADPVERPVARLVAVKPITADRNVQVMNSVKLMPCEKRLGAAAAVCVQVEDQHLPSALPLKGTGCNDETVDRAEAGAMVVACVVKGSAKVPSDCICERSRDCAVDEQAGVRNRRTPEPWIPVDACRLGRRHG